MFCRNCGNELADGAAFCTKCGFQTGTGNKFCEKCGAEVAEGQAVCVKCGNMLKKIQANGVQNKTGTADPNSIPQNPDINADGTIKSEAKVKIILLWFFLGGFGVHNFVMGENKKGILKLILLFTSILIIPGIFLAVLLIMDIIKIAGGSYVANKDALI